jgi:hygromycin-B 7''-O-kinase
MTDPDDAAATADRVRAEFSLGAGIERFATGSLPVFATRHHVIKLFPATEVHHFETEVEVLRRVDGALPIRTPTVVATGAKDDWQYVLMTRLTGRSLADAWPQLGGGDKTRLMHEVGCALARLHSLEVDGLQRLAVDWSRFLMTQRKSCRERQSSHGLGSPWLDRLDRFLADWCPVDDGRRALLHTEVMKEHLLVEQRNGRWWLSGLIDFEPAMIGAPEYEFAAIGIYLTGREPGLLANVLHGYGDIGLSAERLLAYLLLHRYCNLRRYLELLPVTSTTGDLEALARNWFAI